MNEVKNPETQLRCGYAFGVERNLRLLYLGAERHGLRREYAFGVERNLRLLCLGLVRGVVSGKAR